MRQMCGEWRDACCWRPLASPAPPPRPVAGVHISPYTRHSILMPGKIDTDTDIHHIAFIKLRGINTAQSLFLSHYVAYALKSGRILYPPLPGRGVAVG